MTLITIRLMGAMLITTCVVLRAGATNSTLATSRAPVADAVICDDYDNVRSIVYSGKVYFDGSGSDDPDGNVISYSWSFGDGAYKYETDRVCEHAYKSINWNGPNELGDYYEPFHALLTVMDNEFTTNTTYVDVTVYIAGDANGDGIVNIMDATIVGLEWGSSCPPWLCWRDLPDERAGRADLNNDHEVDVLDASIVGTEWMNTA